MEIKREGIPIARETISSTEKGSFSSSEFVELLLSTIPCPGGGGGADEFVFLR
jgi:hypothetical protein